MATLNGTVAGWAVRANKAWFPTSGVSSTSSYPSGVKAVASSPTLNNSTSSSGNKYTVMIAITTPSSTNIGSIDQVSISFPVMDNNAPYTGTLYGSLRTVSQSNGSTTSDTVSTYRTNAIGSEASQYGIGSSYTTVTMSFSGTFSQGTTYYLFLYTKDTSDIYVVNSGTFSCYVTYSEKTYSVSISSPTGITCTSSNSSPTINSTITLYVTITNTAKYAGYSISVSGATLVSGTTYSVNGNVTVTVTGVLQKYAISITEGKGITIKVTDKNGTSYANNSTAPYGTSITITVCVAAGYKLTSFKVNGSEKTGTSVTLTVTSKVTIIATSASSGVIFINPGSGFEAYQVFIYTNGWDLYNAYVYTENGWVLCGENGTSGGSGGNNPTFNYSVESISGSTYGFSLNANGYYESDNKAKSSTYAICRVVFNCSTETSIIVSVINYAESGYDYGIVGNIDIALSASTTGESEGSGSGTCSWNGKASGRHSASPTSLSYTIPAGEHFIDFKYRKDGSVNSNNDSLQFKIEKA